MSRPGRSGQLAICVAIALLVACGGGGDSSPAAGNPGAAPTSSSTGSAGTSPLASPAAPSSPPTAGGSSTPPPFAASVSQAPADAGTLAGTVSLEVRGSGMANVELLPARGFTPRFGSFTISSDGATARLDFNTTAIASGLTQLRVSAFDAAAGDPAAREIVAMPARTWVIINPPATAPILIQLSDLPFRDPAPLVTLNGLGDAELQARLTNGWPDIESLLRLYIPFNVDFGASVPLGFYGPWASCLQGHGLGACREHLTLLIGSMESKRPA